MNYNFCALVRMCEQNMQLEVHLWERLRDVGCGGFWWLIWMVQTETIIIRSTSFVWFRWREKITFEFRVWIMMKKTQSLEEITQCYLCHGKGWNDVLSVIRIRFVLFFPHRCYSLWHSKDRHISQTWTSLSLTLLIRCLRLVICSVGTWVFYQLS